MSSPSNLPKALVIVVVAVLAVGALVLKSSKSDTDAAAQSGASTASSVTGAASAQPSEPQARPDAEGATSDASERRAATPRIVEFGSEHCVPCKLMKPVLASLRSHYGDGLVVEFVDVVKDREAGQLNEIAMIPTQVFYGIDGRELDRHTGFIPEEGIVATFRSHGIELDEQR